MIEKNDIPPIYARFVGQIEFYCPRCGSLQRHKIRHHRSWIVRCTHNQCRVHWGIGLAFHRLRPGRRQRPRDTIFPPARWVTERWKHDGFANILDLKSSLSRVVTEPVGDPESDGNG
jgi:hypothetical protein